MIRVVRRVLISVAVSAIVAGLGPVIGPCSWRCVGCTMLESRDHFDEFLPLFLGYFVPVLAVVFLAVSAAGNTVERQLRARQA